MACLLSMVYLLVQPVRIREMVSHATLPL